MLKTNNLTPLKKIKNGPLGALVISFILIIGISRLLLFLENNISPALEAEAAYLPSEVEVNQMTEIIEDGYLK